MTQDELNRKISEIKEPMPEDLYGRDGFRHVSYPGGWERNSIRGGWLPKNWHSPANAMTLLKEMLIEGRELCIGHWIDAEKRPDKQFYVENDLGNLVGLAETVEAAICAAWLKWKEAK